VSNIHKANGSFLKVMGINYVIPKATVLNTRIKFFVAEGSYGAWITKTKFCINFFKL
jgi:hypothetical protein